MDKDCIFETETINRLFLELSQFTTAKTKREINLEKMVAEAKSLLLKRMTNLLPETQLNDWENRVEKFLTSE